MVKITDLGIEELKDSVVFKEKGRILVEREKGEPIEIVVTETFDGNVFVDVKVRGQNFTNSTYITVGDKYLSGKVNFDYAVIVDTTRYHDGTIVCKYVKEDSHKERSIILSKSKKEVEE